MKKFLTGIISAALAAVMCVSIPRAWAVNADEDPNHATGEQFDIFTSSTIKDYTVDNKQAKHMMDGSLSTYWCSAWVTETTPACSEYILFDFKDIVKVESLTLTARDDGFMFPDGFSFTWSTSNEVDIPIEGQEYSGYENAADNVNKFVFEEPVVARYLKMNITSRTPDESGVHLVCMAEASAVKSEATEAEKQEAVEKDAATERPPVINDPVIQYNISTSSFLDDADKWLPEHLTDKNITTQWCSEWVSTTNEEDEIYVTMTFGEAQKVSGVILTTQGKCFPRDFVFQYTLDNENWLDINGASYKDYELTDSQDQVFAFSTPQVAMAVRLKVTKKTADPSGNYLVQLADVDVRGFTPTQEEVEQATKAFNEAVGNLPDNPDAKPKPIPATPEDFARGCGSAMMGGCLIAGVSVILAAVVLIRKKEKRDE